MQSDKYLSHFNNYIQPKAHASIHCLPMHRNISDVYIFIKPQPPTLNERPAVITTKTVSKPTTASLKIHHYPQKSGTTSLKI